MIVQGKTLVRQSVDYVWSPDIGYSFLPTDIGNKQSVRGLSGIYRQLRIPHRVRHEGPVYEITAEHQLPDDGTAEVPYGSWALIGQQESVDWRQHPAFLALSEDEKWNINKVLKGDFTVGYERFIWYQDTDGQDPITPQPSAGSNADMFLKMALDDQRHYTRTNYTLRHNLTVSQMYKSRLSGVNVNRVYDTNQLLLECRAFADPIPPLMIAEIDAIPALTAQAGYIYGWLKQTPTIQTVAGGRVECSVEYVREVWPLIFYPAKA